MTAQSFRRFLIAGPLAAGLCAFAPSARAADSKPTAVPATLKGTAGGGSDAEAGKPKAAMVIEDGPAASEAPPPFPTGEEKSNIGEYIRQQTRDVVRCYEKRLDDRPTLNGKLKVRFDIGSSGRVIGATAEGISDPTLISCVVQIVRKWEFDKPRSGGKLRVVYPFLFQPVGR